MRGGRVPGSLRRNMLVLAAAVAVATGLTACTAVRDDLGTANGPCYIALPAATAAVHGEGRLDGVRLVSISSLDRSRFLYRTATAARGRGRRVCLVAFRGSFAASRVTKPRGHPSGKLAIVVLDYPENRLLGTVILRHVPVRFGHSHLGARG